MSREFDTYLRGERVQVTFTAERSECTRWAWEIALESVVIDGRELHPLSRTELSELRDTAARIAGLC